MTTRKHSWLATAGPAGPDTALSYTLHPPTPRDGAAIHALIAQCPPLDLNSCYAYLLHGLHLADTCVLARDTEGRLAAYVSGYVPPRQPDTLFIWQVAVAPHARGQGLAGRLLRHLLQVSTAKLHWLETTVSPGNTASERLFRGLARELGAACACHELFPASAFAPGPSPDAPHEAEWLYRIGPFRLRGQAGIPRHDSNPEKETSHASQYL